MFYKLIFLVILPLSTFAQIETYLSYPHASIDLQELLNESHTPGLSIYIDQGNDTDENFQSGYRSSETQEPINDQTIFQAGSCSAIPTALAILITADRGLIDLDRPVNQYLSSWKIQGENAETTTIEDILLYRPRYDQGYKPAGESSETPYRSLQELLQDVSIQSWDDEPSFEYMHWMILQQVLEDVYQVSFSKLMDQLIFSPLNLNRTSYRIDPMDSNFTYGHDKNGNKIKHGYLRYPELASSGLWTTAKELGMIIRSFLDARSGCDNRLLSMPMAQKALSTRFKNRSLLFHINDAGNPYWGGNAQGSYATISISLLKNSLRIYFSNRDLNWKMTNQLNAAILRYFKWNNSKEKIKLFTQTSDQDWIEKFYPSLHRYAIDNSLKIEHELLTTDAPEFISGTPALLYQNGSKSSLYADRHTELSAITQFIRSSRMSTRPITRESRKEVLIKESGKMKSAYILKVTPATGHVAPDSLKLWRKAIIQQLTSIDSLTYSDSTFLLPTDRKFYIDIHRYYSSSKTGYITAQIFSQFNCHQDIWNNFDSPIRFDSDTFFSSTSLASALEKAFNKIKNKDIRLNPIPRFFKTRTIAPVNDRKDSTIFIATSPSLDPINLNPIYDQIFPIRKGVPPVQFNFPAPLDRYSGISEDLTGMLFIKNKTILSGTFEVNIESITMGRPELDQYVVYDALKAKIFNKISLEINPTNIPEIWNTNTMNTLDAIGFLSINGLKKQIDIKCSLTPVLDDNKNNCLQVSCSSTFSIKELFNLEGPDGPENIKNNIQLNTQFILK